MTEDILKAHITLLNKSFVVHVIPAISWKYSKQLFWNKEYFWMTAFNEATLWNWNWSKILVEVNPLKVDLKNQMVPQVWLLWWSPKLWKKHVIDKYFEKKLDFEPKSPSVARNVFYHYNTWVTGVCRYMMCIFDRNFGRKTS